MDRKKMSWITWSFIALAVLAVIFVLLNTLHRSRHITLPDTNTVPDQEVEDITTVGDALSVIQITPETVQAAIENLSRLEAYRRTVTVEQFWNGGSGSYEIATAVNKRWTRTDRTMPDGRVRHCILGPDTVYVWYQDETQIYRAPAGDISADNEQSIPTYEEILDLPVEQISVADYRNLSELACIYVEAVVNGMTLRYWIDTETGLLVAAEKLMGDSLIYRMEALTVDITEPPILEFILPNGTFVAD